MSGSHDVLHHAGDSPVHRLAPHVKILVAFGAVLGVVATPRTLFPLFGLYLLLIVAVRAE